MQWKRNAGRERGEESNCSLGKSKKKKAIQGCRDPTSCKASKEKSVFLTVKNHKSLLSGNISASPGCSTEIAFREISQHLTISRFILLVVFFSFYGLLEQLRASPELKTSWKQRKKTSKVPAAFFSLSASIVFQGK